MVTDYGTFVSYILGMLQSLGILDPLRYMVLFGLSVAGMALLIRMLSGNR